jgi:hypothetical protein
VIASLFAGFLGGTVIAVLAFLAEHSRIGTDGLALYGNGALIVPAVLVPWVLYWGWTWLVARGDGALEMAVLVVGLHFGVGMWVVLDTLLDPQQASLSLLDALPGFALSGSIFVVPGALLAALAYWLYSSGRLPMNTPVLFATAFVGAVLVIAYWIGLGLLAGAAVALARAAPERRSAIGVGLLVVLVILGNLTLLPALFS